MAGFQLSVNGPVLGVHRGHSSTKLSALVVSLGCMIHQRNPQTCLRDRTFSLLPRRL
jgi:hypothetical protein